MRILITGARGQLGQTIMNSTHGLDHELFFTARTVDHATVSDNRYPIGKLDINDADAVFKTVSDNKIDVIINCAGYTDVAGAETEREAAFKANAEAVSNMAEAAKANDALMIHISSDYVFDGRSDIPYKETDKPNPLNEYGRSKLAGDEAVLNSGCRYLIFRISWLYSPYGKNFFKTILRKSKEQPSISVVNDQTGTPTYAEDLVDAIFEAIRTVGIPYKEIENRTDSEATSCQGYDSVYNYSNEGQCTWYEFAKEICRLANSDCKVKPCRTEDYPANVTRPQYSVLDKTRFKEAFGQSVPHWKDALARCLKQIKQNI